MSENQTAMSLEEPGVMVNDPNRRDSYSSEELEIALENSVMDSIEFDPTAPGKMKSSAAATSAATSETTMPPSEAVKKLILASKALRTTGKGKCVYTLRRLAQYFAVRDALCETKGEFAKIYKEIELPGDLDDPEPEYANDLPGQTWVEYAHSRCKEALQALKVAGLETDDQVVKLSKCVSELWTILQQYGKKE